MPSRPRISIIIPVFNEQNTIVQCIQNIRDTCGTDSEIIIVDGSPDASTIATLSDGNITPLHSPPGRARQMNTGAEAASGDLLLFLHADTKLPDNAGSLIRKALNTPACSAGAFKLGFSSSSQTMKLIAFIADLRTRLERVPYGDQAVFIRKDTFQKLGGFPEIPIMEDVELFRLIKRKRLEIVILKETIYTSARRYETTGPWRCCIRNIFLRILHLCGVSPFKLSKMYRRNG